MTPTHERIAVFFFGVVFLTVMLVLAVFFPTPSAFQYLVFKVTLGLAAAGIAALIPGFLEVNIPTWLKAGGALAVFALVMYKSPADLVSTPPLPAATVEIQVDPDTVGIAASAYHPVTYRFREVNGVQVTIDSEDIKWLTLDGLELKSEVGSRVLGGSFTIRANGTHNLLDNIWLPPTIATDAANAGINQVQLVLTFRGSDANGHPISVKSILRVGVLAA